MEKKVLLFKWVVYVSLITSLYFLPAVCRMVTDGFSLARITSEFPPGITWDAVPAAASDVKECNDALNQPYRYLGSGGQCFAFISQDDRYVIKFFKTRFIKFGSLFFQTLPFIPEKTRQRKIEKALFKLRRDFNSYLIASRDLKEESGILYLHLNKTTDLRKNLRITDKLGINHTVDLDQMEFAIQRRAELAYPYIDSLIRKKQFEKAKSAIHSLIDISVKRCKKGIYDEDAKIERNFGFLDEQPLLIDIGRFVRDPSRQNREIYQQDLHGITRQLRTWIETQHPDLTDYFNKALHFEET
jgi:hypothetical protein